MSIHERLTEFQSLEAEAQAAEKARQQDLQKERGERYSRECDSMILEQRKLFEELKEIGVIGMLEEMTTLHSIYPLRTKEERAESLRTMMERPFRIVPQSEVRRIFDKVHSTKWQGQMVDPEQNEDGSMDSTLRIKVDNNTLGPGGTGFGSKYSPPLQCVLISYSQNKVLTIKGDETTFEGVVTREKSDTNALEEGLAKAFFKPKIKRESNPQPHTNRLPYSF